VWDNQRRTDQQQTLGKRTERFASDPPLRVISQQRAALRQAQEPAVPGVSSGARRCAAGIALLLLAACIPASRTPLSTPGATDSGLSTDAENQPDGRADSGHAALPDSGVAEHAPDAGSIVGRNEPDAGGKTDGGGLADAGVASVDAGVAWTDGGITHVLNPFAGATFYVNPEWAANVGATAASTSDSTLAAEMNAVAGTSTAVWMDSMAAIAPADGGMGLEAHLQTALSQQQGSTPIEATFVIYDLPGRDCAALASNGELPATAAGLATYESSYIDPIVSILSEPAFSGIRIVTIIEPDSLPNLVTNAGIQACATAGPLYEQGIEYALDHLRAIPNVYIYLDSAHSGWLGWTSNSGPMATEFAKVANATHAGFGSVDGFITDTANYTPLHEPYMSATEMIGGSPVESASFYQWNPELDETDFAADMYTLLTNAGFSSDIGMLIDTSRSGWGGSARPADPSSSTNLNTFVGATKIDQRAHRGLWCNVSGAGLGERPQANPSGYPASHLHAYVWVKPPGESDGTSSQVVNSQGKMPDPNCNPAYTTSYGVLTGAMPNAPLAGQWFPAQFTALVQNAWPVVAP
jgi:cellulose 1,4-beta-cellobiosidase